MYDIAQIIDFPFHYIVKLGNISYGGNLCLIEVAP